MSDEKFEEFLQREAKAYHTPPATTPRDEMWQVIAAERARSARSTRPARSTRSIGWRMAPWIGMAATLLVGVGIGRFALQRGANGGANEAPASAPIVATAPTPAAVAPAGVDAGVEISAPIDASPRVLVPSRATPSRVSTVANNGRGTLDPTTPMQVASREHLVRAEALISIVSATAADVVMDSLTSRWSHDMLTSTRLLIDSPAGEDPVRRRLLEDLESVLVQLVQRSGAPVDERALLDRSLHRTQLLTRLRTSAATPSGI